MVWIGSFRCEKIKREIAAGNFELIAAVWLVLHPVSSSSETVQNAPDRKETHQNMILGSNSVDRERSLQKNLIRHHGLSFCINCTSLARFAASFVQ